MDTLTYTIRLLIIAAVAFFLGGCLRKKPKIEIGNLNHFTFSYSVGNYMFGSYNYGIDLKDDKYIAYYKADGVSDEDRLEKEITKEEVTQFEEELSKLNISTWDGFQKSDKNVLDGNSFHLYFQNTDKKSISASGYEKWPDNYGTVKGMIEEFFLDLFKDEIKK